MKWSKWSAAGVMMLASAGSTWSQAPSSTSAVNPTTAPQPSLAAKVADGAAERFMTLHENGKSTRCRIVSSWKTSEGASAYQIQAIDGGEMITSVADGPEAAAKDAAAKSNALPMRIYHWGRSRVAPPGVPTNPGTAKTTMPVAPPSAPVTLVSATSASPSPAPVATTPVNATSTAPISTVISTKALSGSKEQVIWWEEKDGKRVSPAVVTSGKNPFENQTVVQGPVSGQPVPVVMDNKGSTLVTLPAKDEPRMFTSAPTVRTVVHVDPSVPVTTMPMANGDSERIISVQEKSPRLLQKLFPPKPSVSQAEQVIVTTPSVAPAKVQTASTATAWTSTSSGTPAPAAKTTGTMAPLAQSASPAVPTSAATVAGSIATTAEVATITKVEIVPEQKPSLLAKIGNVFHPKRNADVARSIESKDFASSMSDTATTKSSGNPAPFSTATDRSVTERGSKAPAATADTSASLTKKDWRSMWGRMTEKSQMPGQSMVDQASSPQGDILLNPEKFDPAGNKLVPRGINMAAYRGDAAQLMAKNQATGTQQTKAQGGASQFPSSLPPPLPGDGNYPPGYQSVVAASNPNLAYVPVPPASSTRLSEPPANPTYVNAFTPPPPNVPVNAFSNRTPPPAPPQMAQRIPQAGPPIQLPSPAPMAPATYPPAYQAQQIPGPATIQLPPAVQVPVQTPMQAPMQQPTPQQAIQPIQYTAPPVPASSAQPPVATSPMANPAMDRRQTPPTSAPSSELAQVLNVLRESPYPAQREWAANTMATYDWRAHPEVVKVLLQVAQQDPAATVRASCVYSLGRMNAFSEPVLGVLRMLSNDSDARVRDEVEHALARMVPAKQ